MPTWSNTVSWPRLTWKSYQPVKCNGFPAPWEPVFSTDVSRQDLQEELRCSLLPSRKPTHAVEQVSHVNQKIPRIMVRLVGEAVVARGARRLEFLDLVGFAHFLRAFGEFFRRGAEKLRCLEMSSLPVSFKKTAASFAAPAHGSPNRARRRRKHRS
jgi:hypothetical protein